MAYIPIGSLVFSGRGQGPGGVMRYYSPSGVQYAQPSVDPIPGNGADGIGTLFNSHCIAIVGGNSPNFGTTGIGIFNPDGTVRAQGTAFSGSPGFGGQGYGQDSSDRFYTYKPSVSAGDLFRWDKDGTPLDRYVGVLTTESNFFQGLAINYNGTSAYYGKYKSGTSRRDTIAKYVLGGATTELLTIGGGWKMETDWGMMCYFDDIIVGWTNSGSGKLIRYGSGGSVSLDYTSLIPFTGGWDPIALTPGLTLGTFWFSYYDYGQTTPTSLRVIEMRVSDGAILHDFVPDDGGAYWPFDTEFAVLREPLGTAPSVSPTDVCVPQGSLTYPRGTIVQFNSVPDTIYFFDKATGSVLGTLAAPGSVNNGFGQVARVDTGEWMVTQNYAAAFPPNFQFFNDDLTSSLANLHIANTGSEEPGASVGSNKFFATNATGLARYSASGSPETSWTTSNPPRDRMAVSPNGTIVYHGSSGNSEIYKTVLGGSTTLFVSTPDDGLEGGAHRGMLTIPQNGNLVVAWRDGITNAPKVTCYDTSGNPVWNSYPTIGAGFSFCYTKDMFMNEDDTKIWAPVQDNNSNLVRWYQLDAATGTATQVFTTVIDSIYSNGPAWVLRYCAPTPPVPTYPAGDGGPGQAGTLLPQLNVGLHTSGPTETYNFAKRPLRDPATYFGGPKPARVAEMGTIPRIASDWFTGAWQAQSATLKIIDTDHYMRGRLAASANPGFSSGEYWAYVIDNADRLALMQPRLIYYGTIRESPFSENLTYTLNANDIISAGYSLYAAEEPIPRVRIANVAFPHLPDSLANPHTGVPLIFGEVSDEAKAAPKGKIKLINVGPMVLNGTTYPAVGLVSLGAIDQILNAYKFDSVTSSWVRITTWGTDIWAPGMSGWTTIVPSNAKYVVGIDGIWYTLIPMSGTMADDFNKNTAISINARGMCYNSDGTGGMISKLFDQYKVLWSQFVIQSWTSGPWMTTPLFEFWPGGASIPLLDEPSFDAAQTLSGTYCSGGFLGSFVLGANGQRTTVRQLIQDMNTCAGNTMLTRNYKMQLSYRMLNRSRSAFLSNGYKVNWKRDQISTVRRPTMTKRDWLYNIIVAAYDYNYNTGAYEGSTVRVNSASNARYGDQGVDRNYSLLGGNLPTVQAVADEQLLFMQNPPRPYTWAETLRGLRYDVLDGVAITDYEGMGVAGYANRGMWVFSQSIDTLSSLVTMQAYDVDPLLS